ncbi:MAG: hypothetical protein GY788_00935 [bacterium]|nr:hypothetical protein [bacterium]
MPVFASVPAPLGWIFADLVFVDEEQSAELVGPKRAFIDPTTTGGVREACLT